MAISDLDYTDDSDVALIRRTRSGDLDAYGLLHQRHAGSARALAWRMSRSAADADDLVSEGFARVLSAIQRGNGPEVAFRPYLLSTVRRLAYDRTNRERRESPVDYELDEPIEPAGDPVVEGFERDTAAAAFASLPERWRMVLWHTEVEGQSPAEVAALLGIKPNAVAALAYRAREGLRQAYLTQHTTTTPAAAGECRLTSERLAAYVRGGLTGPQEARVRRHLESCDDCQAAYLELASVNTSMRSLIGVALLGPLLPGYLAEVASPTALPAAGTGGAAAGGVAARRAARAGRRLAGLSRGRVVAVAASVAFVALVAAALATADDGPKRTVVLGQRVTQTDPSPDRRPAASVPAGPSPSGPVPTAPGTTPPTAVTPTTAPAVPPAAPAVPVRRPAAGAPPATTTPPATTPTTTPVVRSGLTLDLGSAGPLVAGRPGVVVVTVGNAGPGAGRSVEVVVDLARMTLRGLPRFPGAGSAAGAAPQAAWSCQATTPSQLTCRAAGLAAGSPVSFYVPVTVAPGTAPAGASGRVDGIDNTVGPGATPSVQMGVNPSGMSARFATIDRGGVVSIGNTLLTCDANEAGCLDARRRVGSGGALDNGAYAMVPVDVDGDPSTANSSSAAWKLPAGGEVLSAQLYWAGDLQGTVPPADPSARDRAVVRGPDGAASTVIAERVDESGTRYQAVADVTDLVRAGGAGSWTVGGVQLAGGVNNFGGWSLVVVVAEPAAPLRSLVVLDGLTSVSDSSLPPFTVGGFVVPTGGARSASLHAVAYEGDAGLVDDQLSLGGRPVVDGLNPLGNTFNSTASVDGVLSSGGAGADTNLFGLDVDRFDVTELLAPGATTVDIGLTTTQDVFLLGALAFTVDQ